MEGNPAKTRFRKMEQFPVSAAVQKNGEMRIGFPGDKQPGRISVS